MVLACIGSLLGWQFTIAQVHEKARSVTSADLAKATKGNADVGMVLLAADRAGPAHHQSDLSKQSDTWSTSRGH